MIQKLVRIKHRGDRNYGFRKGQLVNWYVFSSVVRDMKYQGLSIPKYDKVVVKDI